MQDILIAKLHAHIRDNHPDILFLLQEENGVTNWLQENVNSARPMIDELINEGRPNYIIEELCMRSLKEGLGPSKYNYILHILEDAFPETYNHLLSSGLLRYEAINLINACEQGFKSLPSMDESDNADLLEADIISTIHDYLNRQINN